MTATFASDSDLFAPTLLEQIREVQREIGQRERVYPRMIANGQLTRKRADRQIAVMKAALATLEKLQAP
jgi:hypothetical protein